MLSNASALFDPNFDKQFKLPVDASDIGAGGVLLQEDENGVDHPVCYFLQKFNKHQRVYSKIEKECLALILSLQFFEVYVSSSSFPLTVFTDKYPLTFLHKIKKKKKKKKKKGGGGGGQDGPGSLT